LKSVGSFCRLPEPVRLSQPPVIEV
jgi:hypothetical protein